MAATETAEKTGTKSSLVLTLAVLAVMSVAAAGGGWLVGEIVAPAEEQAPAAAAAGGHGEGEEEEGHEAETGPALITLDPITSNLAYPAENWVRLEVSLVFEGEADQALGRAIHQDILAYLRTVSLQQIQGARGFQHLREDLVERARLRSEGKVTDIMFRTFVIE